MIKRRPIVLTFLWILILCNGCSNAFEIPVKEQDARDTEVTVMNIVIQDKQDHMLTFQLNNSPAAKSLYEQLPLITVVENYSDNEKIFYPPKELNIQDTPLANGVTGTLAYYEPWGDIVIFYGNYNISSDLFELGVVTSNNHQIKELHGELEIYKDEKNR